MVDPAESATLLLVLRDLRRSDGKAVMRSAVKELVARDVLRLHSGPADRRGRRDFELTSGPAPQPSERVLRLVSRWIEEAPSHVRSDGLVARDMAQAATHLASRPGSRKQVVDAALEELLAAGLVVTEVRKALGVFPRTVHARTPRGEQVLAAGQGQARDRDRGGGDTGVFPVYGAGDSADGDDLSDSRFGHIDGAVDAGVDSSFDSSFDSGFSSGDGGGSDGGDGGGGGGD